MVQDSNGLYYMQLSTDHMNMTKWLTNEQRGLLFKLVFAYFCDEMTEQEVVDSIPEEYKIILPIWSNIQISINRSKAAYSEKCRINSNNGKKGGAPKGNQNARKKALYTADEGEEESEDYSSLEDMSDEEMEIIMRSQHQNSELAYRYQCFSTELQENGYHVYVFFNWNQLVEFLNFYMILHIMYTVLPCYSDKTFFMFFQDGFNGFLRKITELGTDGLIAELKEQIHETYKQTLIDDSEMNEKETEKIVNRFMELSSYSKGIENILLDVAELDEDLMILLNNK